MTTDHDDLDHIMAVMEQAFDPQFGEAWNRRQVEDALLLGNCHYGLAMDGNTCAGFFLSRFGFDEEELLLLGVVPALRRRGHGAALLEQFLAEAVSRGAQRAMLEMRRGNPAEILYRNHGFEQIGCRPNYYRGKYGDRSDALTFASKLDL
jgi:[ribosomal protein S18]-alanine N-acetyltransferase